MRRTPLVHLAVLCTLGTLAGCASTSTNARVPGAEPAVFGPAAEDTILLTIFLRHDQSKTLDELRTQLEKTGFWKTFPPEGIEVESWKIVMGIGQVVTLKVPPSRLREVNRAIETTAWGAYRTEFYATYDFMQVAAEQRARALGADGTGAGK